MFHSVPPSPLSAEHDDRDQFWFFNLRWFVGTRIRPFDEARGEGSAPGRTAHVSEVLPLRKNSMAVDVLLVLLGPDTVAPSVSVADLQVLSPLFEHR